MALFYQHNINETKLGIWKIEEVEEFFINTVSLQREITHPHKRLQHLAGRYLLKQLFPDFPNEEIEIADTKKPFLPLEQYHFSISHCSNFAAAIVSKTERVGIDIEISTERILKISDKFLSEEEKKLFFISGTGFHAKEHNNKLRTNNYKLVTILWGAKEAVYKWWGWGEINFSEHISLQPFKLSSSGDINALFQGPQQTFSLQLQYKLFEELSLVWLSS